MTRIPRSVAVRSLGVPRNYYDFLGFSLFLRFLIGFYGETGPRRSLGGPGEVLGTGTTWEVGRRS